jgi:diacylglycerol kinase
VKRNVSFGAAFRNAVAGLKYMLSTQRNARIHLAATISVTVLGIWLNLSINQWILIVIAIGLVWIAEMFNTSLECFFDLIEPEENKIVKAGKDTSAAAVLITSLLSAIIGILVLGPLLFQKIAGLFIDLGIS